jgi:hypothetical protein
MRYIDDIFINQRPGAGLWRPGVRHVVVHRSGRDGPQADVTADKHSAPDLMLRPNVGIFHTLDFMQASAVLRAAEPVKAEAKEKLGRLPKA